MDNYQKLRNFHGARRTNQLLNISFKNKYIWFKNAKVASSTLSKSLQLLEVKNVPALKTRPHPGIEASVHIKPYQLPDEVMEDMLVSDDFFRFTFVRNPFIRIVSAYKDKIAGGKPEKVFVLKMLGLPKDDFDVDISFETFVDAVCSNSLRKQDQHWMPQIITTCAHWAKPHFVGKIENFQQDFEALGEKLGIDLSEHYHFFAPHRSHADNSYLEFYKSDEIRQKIIDYFAKDFEIFGYSKELA